jgi:hypothetical protein
MGVITIGDLQVNDKFQIRNHSEVYTIAKIDPSRDNCIRFHDITMGKFDGTKPEDIKRVYIHSKDQFPKDGIVYEKLKHEKSRITWYRSYEAMYQTEIGAGTSILHYVPFIRERYQYLEINENYDILCCVCKTVVEQTWNYCTNCGHNLRVKQEEKICSYR